MLTLAIYLSLPGQLMVVELDRRLVEAPEGGRVLTQLQEAGLACRVVEGRVPASVIFFRMDPLSGEVRIALGL